MRKEKTVCACHYAHWLPSPTLRKSARDPAPPIRMHVWKRKRLSHHLRKWYSVERYRDRPYEAATSSCICICIVPMYNSSESVQNECGRNFRHVTTAASLLSISRGAGWSIRPVEKLGLSKAKLSTEKVLLFLLPKVSGETPPASFPGTGQEGADLGPSVEGRNRSDTITTSCDN